MDTNRKTEIGEFFNAWTLYRKVLANNYMFHREIYQSVAERLHGQLGMKPFKLLDLGCGDASYLAKALKGTAISHYTGYDLSAPALALAAENIGPLGCDTTLVNGDFMAGLVHAAGPFDVIFTSFAMHHLHHPEKAECFKLARAALSDGGFLLMIDTLRDPGQSLPDYLNAYCQWLEATWQQLETQEIAAACQHIRDNDLPETAHNLIKWAHAAGFTQTQQICAWKWHRAWQFSS